MLFAWIIISCIVDKAVLVKLSVFDSPPALKNILRLENSLNKYLVRMRSQNTKYVTSEYGTFGKSFFEKTEHNSFIARTIKASKLYETRNK